MTASSSFWHWTGAKMKERILIGTEQQIRFRLDGNKDNDVIYDITRPLGRFLIDFEYDKEKNWNIYGLSSPT